MHPALGDQHERSWERMQDAGMYFLISQLKYVHLSAEQARRAFLFKRSWPGAGIPASLTPLL